MKRYESYHEKEELMEGQSNGLENLVVFAVVIALISLVAKIFGGTWVEILKVFGFFIAFALVMALIAFIGLCLEGKD